MISDKNVRRLAICLVGKAMVWKGSTREGFFPSIVKQFLWSAFDVPWN